MFGWRLLTRKGDADSGHLGICELHAMALECLEGHLSVPAHLAVLGSLVGDMWFLKPQRALRPDDLWGKAAEVRSGSCEMIIHKDTGWGMRRRLLRMLSGACSNLKNYSVKAPRLLAIPSVWAKQGVLGASL